MLIEFVKFLSGCVQDMPMSKAETGEYFALTMS